MCPDSTLFFTLLANLGSNTFQCWEHRTVLFPYTGSTISRNPNQQGLVASTPRSNEKTAKPRNHIQATPTHAQDSMFSWARFKQRHSTHTTAGGDSHVVIEPFAWQQLRLNPTANLSTP